MAYEPTSGAIPYKISIIATHILIVQGHYSVQLNQTVPYFEN
jgi:hypothetical protein